MSKVDASSEAVRARIGVLETDYAADGAGFDAKLLAALLARAESAEAERDDARVGEKFWREHCDEVCENSRDGNAALTEIDECWLATGMMTNRALLSLSEQISALQCEHESDLAAARETIAAVTKQREDADHDADLARSQLGSVAMDNADLRATIARLTADVQAAREALDKAHGKLCLIAGTEAWTDACLSGWMKAPGALRQFAEDAATEIDSTGAKVARAHEAEILLDRAMEELRLIRAKDCGAVYDTMLRADAQLFRARANTKEPTT